MKTNAKSGFTLIEMIAVLLIIALVAAASTAGLSKAKDKAWRTQARELCRQLNEAWNAYLVDERKFPSELGAAKGLEAKYNNIKYLAGANESDKVYIELTDKEKGAGSDGGLRDHWNGMIYFSLDADYDGKVDNPAPEARAVDDDDKAALAAVTASAISWSKGKDPQRKKKWIVVW